MIGRVWDALKNSLQRKRRWIVTIHLNLSFGEFHKLYTKVFISKGVMPLWQPQSWPPLVLQKLKNGCYWCSNSICQHGTPFQMKFYGLLRYMLYGSNGSVVQYCYPVQKTRCKEYDLTSLQQKVYQVWSQAMIFFSFLKKC